MIYSISEAIRSLGDNEILRATNSFQNGIDACIVENGALNILLEHTFHSETCVRTFIRYRTCKHTHIFVISYVTSCGLRTSSINH